MSLLRVFTALVTKSVEQATDWTQVAQNSVAKSGVFDCSLNAKTLVHVQAALDTTTAHTNGTGFIVQTSSNTSGDEDWQDYSVFAMLQGTAETAAINDNPLSAGSTTISIPGNSLTSLAKYLFIKDGTIANSELVFQTAQTTNTINVLDRTSNSHIQATPIYTLAFSESMILDYAVSRVRLVVNNTLTPAGSTVCYKFRASKILSM